MSEQNSAAAQETELRTYTKRERNFYFAGLAGQNIIYNIINTSLIHYLQFVIYIPVKAIGAITTLARVWDAFNDPMMGTLVDRTRTKWGKCRPYLIFSPVVITVITILCFTNFGLYDVNAPISDSHNMLMIIYAAVTYILWGMSYTVGDIPLWGVTALMTENNKDRDRLLSNARIWASIGAGITLLTILSVSIGVGNQMESVAGGYAEGQRMGFIVVAAIFSVVGGGLFQLAGPNIKERIEPSEETHTLKENFSLMWKNKPFRQILLSGVLGSPKQTLAISAMQLVTYYYSSKNPTMAMLYMVLLGGGLFIGQFLSMALVPKILTKMSKKNAYNYANLIGTIPYLALFVMYQVAPSHDVTTPFFLLLSFAFFFIGGGALGITMALQSLMIADAVDYEEYQSGIRPDGVFFSGQTFIAKLTAGIATIITTVCYNYVGFSDARIKELDSFIAAGGIPRFEPKYSRFMMILFFVCSIPPAIGSILSVIPTWRYALDDNEHERIIAELNERRHAINAAE